MKYISKNILFVCCMLSATAAFAEVDAVSWVYPGASIEDQNVSTSAASLYLSAPKRVSNSLRFERSQKLAQAKVTGLLQRLGSDEDMIDVLGYYRNLITETGRLEFVCEQRACGTSTNWANRLYEISKLTGRDDNQYYAIGLLEDGLTWVSAYIVTNGRRQNYVYVQVIEDLSQPESLPSLQGNLLVHHEPVTALNSQRLTQLFQPEASLESQSGGASKVVVQIHFSWQSGFQAGSEDAETTRKLLVQRLGDSTDLMIDQVEFLLAGPVNAQQNETLVSIWRTQP